MFVCRFLVGFLFHLHLLLSTCYWFQQSDDLPLPRSTVADSDLLVCLSKGEVAEVGSPEAADTCRHKN